MVLLVARHPNQLPVYVLAAATGSTIGVLLLDLVCRKGGGEGLKRLVKPKLLDYLKRQMERHAAAALIVSCLAPPPFPFGVFVAAASAFQYSRPRLMVLIFIARAIRFSLVGWAAIYFGRQILRVANSIEFLWVMGGFIAFCVIGSIVSPGKRRKFYCAVQSRFHVSRRQRCSARLQGSPQVVSAGGRPGDCQRAVESRFYVRQGQRCSAKLRSGVYVVQPGRDQWQCQRTKQSRFDRPKNDSGANCGSTASGPRVETPRKVICACKSIRLNQSDAKWDLALHAHAGGDRKGPKQTGGHRGRSLTDLQRQRPQKRQPTSQLARRHASCRRRPASFI